MARTVSVFVYGTLRLPLPDTPPHDCRYYFEIEPHIKSAEPAHLPQTVLFDMGAYPAAARGQGTVRGDLLHVRRLALDVMDQIEGHPEFFRREKVRVFTESGTAQAWVYWAPRGLTTGRSVIGNGDWLQRGQADVIPPEIPAPADGDPVLRQLIQRLAAAECSWMSTVRPNGHAHCVPVWHVWHIGRAYVVTPSGSVKMKNLRANPSVSLAHQDALDPVILEGWGTTAPHMKAELQPLFKEKYEWDILTDSEYDTVVEIIPLKLLAWGKYGEGRWPGEAVMQISL